MLSVVLESTRSIPSCDIPGRYQCAVTVCRSLSPTSFGYQAAIRQLRGDGHQLQVTSQNCVEFWNVATRPIERKGLLFYRSKMEKLKVFF